ncbi:ATP12 family chaperone protein [Erythrobacter litoralis]|uniref:Chaperone n=1 Tax=Erythrobacter litoralis (strain HTCC2594) TaxID=314225 RepID=Q2ND83_ERYLH|nr:ATP12 family protein [Erythrobacter litoralis]ABC62358.1 chaperone [Erythrobacter litoralis HTCC2594]
MKKFWKEVSVEQVDGGYQVALDGRGIRTQGKRPQIVQTAALAELLADEWRAQGKDIDPASFPHRDMADYAIDRIATAADDIPAKLIGFMETDTLCYRADPDEPLYKRQLDMWEPLVTAFEMREDIRVERASGIIHKPQPPESLAKLRARIDALDPFTLAALFATTSLSASLIIGLGTLEADADSETLWDAANCEEDWQVELWGDDFEAADRRARRKRDFLRAVEFARASATP